MPAIMVKQKKTVHPPESVPVHSEAACTEKPVTGPAISRGRPNRLEKSAYCVAEKRFCVMRNSSTPKAPMPRPVVKVSKERAPYIKRRSTSLRASMM